LYLVYSILLGLAFAAALPFYLWKGARTGKYLSSFRERLGRSLPPLGADGAPALWVHAVSVGEVLIARPLGEALRQRLPGQRVVLSTTTLTGMALARQGAGSAVFFAPFDLRGPVRRALEAVRPRLLVLVETELWPNLIHEARRSGARVAIVNGRLSPRSYSRYRFFRRLLRPVLRDVDLFLMQSEAHANRIRALGAPPDRVSVPGNLKYDALPEPRPTPLLGAVRARGGRLWVAGSTMDGEEEKVLDAFAAIRAAAPDLRLVLAPRHPERFASAVAAVEGRGMSWQRRTALGESPWTEGDVLVLDTIGELAALYEAAAVVFVGGSLVEAGGHNVLEPAAAGKPVVVGPHMENFREIAEAFVAEDALIQVAGEAELTRMVGALLSEPTRAAAMGARARALVERHRGAMNRTAEALVSLLAEGR
jgi:3-deoxy-D-manno-octulosonic-acid transferase